MESETMKNFTSHVVDFGQAIRNLNDRMERVEKSIQKLDEDIGGTNKLLHYLLQKIENLDSKWSGSSVYVVEDAANCNAGHNPHTQAQVFTIPNTVSSMASSFEQKRQPDAELILKAHDTVNAESLDDSATDTHHQLNQRENVAPIVEAMSIQDQKTKSVPELDVHRVGRASTNGRDTDTIYSGKKGDSSVNWSVSCKSRSLPNSYSSVSVRSRSAEVTVQSSAMANVKLSNKIPSPNEPSRIITMEKIFFCPYCPRQFEHNHSIALHIRSCKKKHEMDAQKKAVHQHKDVNCSDLKTLNPNTTGSLFLMEANGNENLRKQLDKMIKCGYCARSFPTQHQVTSHERVHTGDRPYSCYVCSIKFAHGGNMIKHIKSKHPKQNAYVCSQCQKNFKTHYEVQTHRKECGPSRRSYKRRKQIFPKDVQNNDGGESEETITASEDENSLDRLPLVPLPQLPVTVGGDVVQSLKFETIADKSMLTTSTYNIDKNISVTNDTNKIPSLQEVKIEVDQTSPHCVDTANCIL